MTETGADIEGGCLCGAVRFRSTAAPVATRYCWCRDCQYWASGNATVNVVFSLPAETTAERVALCGDFNDWAPEGISLTRAADRSWQVTVPLVPGSYRYKYLLDGVTWENGPDADRYEENAYGTLDSVIEVSSRL